MNLASQSVLEGLNAILDHRGSVFIPETNMIVTKHKNFRLFATQNPISLGGGRKGLPRSFMNRFSKIFVPNLKDNDIIQILESLYPDIDRAILDCLLSFNKDLQRKLRLDPPNLRTLIRFCSSLSRTSSLEKSIRSIYILSESDEQKRNLIKLTAKDYFKERISTQNLEFSETSSRGLLFWLKSNHLSPIITLNKYNRIIPDVIDILDCNFPIIISGGSHSGKKSFIKLLAELKKKKNIALLLDAIYG